MWNTRQTGRTGQRDMPLQLLLAPAVTETWILSFKKDTEGEGPSSDRADVGVNIGICILRGAASEREADDWSVLPALSSDLRGRDRDPAASARP